MNVSVFLYLSPSCWGVRVHWLHSQCCHTEHMLWRVADIKSKPVRLTTKKHNFIKEKSPPRSTIIASSNNNMMLSQHRVWGRSGSLFLVCSDVCWFESEFTIEVVSAALVQRRTTIVDQTLLNFLNLLHRVSITLRWVDVTSYVLKEKTAQIHSITVFTHAHTHTHTYIHTYTQWQ